MDLRQIAALAQECQSSGPVRPPHGATGLARKRPAVDGAYTGPDGVRVPELK